MQEWSDLLGKSVNGIRMRYYKGKNYTTEEVIKKRSLKSNRIKRM